MTREEFLFPIYKRNAEPDVTDWIPEEWLESRFDNPICKKCHEDYQKKFPDRPFSIVCKGITSDAEIASLAADPDVGLEEEEIREIESSIFWASRHIRLVNQAGEYVPFKPRWYQEEILACTARRKVDRLGRGLGKTSLGAIEELHCVTTRKNYSTLIACPAKSQASKWYDDIQQHLKNDPELEASLKSTQQAPYYKLTFHNGSVLSIFTTGSESGRDAKTIRAQSPRRIRIDEQDYLNEGDYKSIMPLLRRYKESEFHGSSTPSGARETYWEMCTQYTDYKEFHFPISVHPDWGSEFLNEDICRREARTEANYFHEYLAEFGDLEDGVFKQNFIDAAKQPWKYSEKVYHDSRMYVMGVDWNGKGTGTRIRVVEFDPASRMRTMVDHRMVNESTRATLDAIRDMNRKWHCSKVMVDAGFGFVQDEFLREMGAGSSHPDDRKLVDIHVIDFGASIRFNRLVPRTRNKKYIEESENELDRRTKPFIVEGAVMCLEAGMFAFSEHDGMLEDQLRAYRVKSWSMHGFANTYDSSVGDHDLDATMLALLGIELNYGLFEPKKQHKKVASMEHVGPLGMGRADNLVNGPTPQITPRDLARQAAGVPSRGHSVAATEASNNRLSYLQRFGGGMFIPGQKNKTGVTQPGRGSRTSAFTRSRSPVRPNMPGNTTVTGSFPLGGRG